MGPRIRHPPPSRARQAGGIAAFGYNLLNRFHVGGAVLQRLRASADPVKIQP